MGDSDLGMSPTTTQAGYAASWVNRAILAGLLGPGDRLKQDDIAEQIGMSLIPVREALRRLVGDGQLHYVPRRGYFVAELSRADMQEIYETRGILEDHLLKDAIGQYTDEDIALLEAQRQRCTDALARGDVFEATLGHWDFFAAMLFERNHPYSMKLLRQLWQVTNAYAPRYYASDAGRAVAEEVRSKVLAAILKRDDTALMQHVARHRRESFEVLLSFAS